MTETPAWGDRTIAPRPGKTPRLRLLFLINFFDYADCEGTRLLANPWAIGMARRGGNASSRVGLVVFGRV